MASKYLSRIQMNLLYKTQFLKPTIITKIIRIIIIKKYLILKHKKVGQSIPISQIR